MHQSHFLLSAAARGRSLREVFALSEAEAFELFREVRWGRDGDPVCPSCGAVDRHRFLRSRQQWRCRVYGHTFSVTSGTIFAHHKLPLQVYLGAIASALKHNQRPSGLARRVRRPPGRVEALRRSVAEALRPVLVRRAVSGPRWARRGPAPQ